MKDRINALIRAAGPEGLSPEALLREIDGPSRSTLNRRLSELIRDGVIKPLGAGRAVRYVSTAPMTRAEIDAYFQIPANGRPVARFKDSLLEAQPNIDPQRAERLVRIQSLAQAMDRRFLSEFLVDFAWASSLLEGSTYSSLDTEALVKYGQQNRDKPTEDAVLALDHKRAGEHLWTHRELGLDNICAMHALLTDNHDAVPLDESDHFLPPEQRGRPRVHEDVRLQNSAYLPPFRPGTTHARDALLKIIETATALPPVEASVYLLSRIPYVQSFANGNKRTARIACNLPLLNAGLLPFSFVDVDKVDYIRGMAAFYELGDISVLEQTFIDGYVKSIMRASEIPVAMRGSGYDPKAWAADLVGYVNTGKLPAKSRAGAFLGTGQPAGPHKPSAPPRRPGAA